MSADRGNHIAQNLGGDDGNDPDEADPEEDTEEPLTSIWDSRFIIRVPGGWQCVLCPPIPPFNTPHPGFKRENASKAVIHLSQLVVPAGSIKICQAKVPIAHRDNVRELYYQNQRVIAERKDKKRHVEELIIITT